MSNFRTFETAYKKALSNNRRSRDAVQYALNRFIAHMIEELDFRADAETRECFADEAFEVYCDARNDHDTHGDAAHAATEYIELELRDADSGRESRSGGGSSRWSSSRGESRGSGSNSSSQGKGSFGTQGKPFYNYDDPRNNHTASSARSKPFHNYDDPRNARPSPSTRSKTAYSSEGSYDSYPEPPGASDQGSCGCGKDRGSRLRGEPLYDYEDMFDALPKVDRGSDHCRKDRAYSRRDSHDSHYDESDHCRKDRGHSRHDYTSHYEGSDSSMPPPRRARSDHDNFHDHSDSHHGHSGRQRPPMPAGFGRFKFPSPIFTKGSRTAYSFFSTHEFRPTHHGRHNTREFRPTDHSRHDTREFCPSHHSEHDTHESRPKEGGHDTREFKPSWYGGDNSGSPRPYESRAPPRPSEYGYEYTSESRAPPRHSHKSSRGPSPSSHNTRSNPPPASEPINIKHPTCYYTVLGISRTATPDQIKAAYRKMSMKHHPDRVAGADKEKATAKMVEINKANDVLSDVVKRQYYDRMGCVPGLD